MPVAMGILAHGLYYKLLATFPFTEMTSPVFIASVGEFGSLTRGAFLGSRLTSVMVNAVVLCLSHYFWITYFSETWYSLAYIMG